MSVPFLALLVGFLQGLLHGVGPDHCAAVATLGTAARGRKSALLTAVRFAVGHAVVLGVLASGCLLLGFGISETFERWSEILGGAVLVAVALTALFFPGALAHGHPHLPGHDHHHTHARVSTAAGALMAISGARSLLLALPPLMVGGAFSLSAWVYLPGFALGILVSMGAVGLLVAEGMSRMNQAIAERLQRVVAAGSGVVGLVWIASRL
jgi:nickel/cobalt transporter (NicO) family protein